MSTFWKKFIEITVQAVVQGITTAILVVIALKIYGLI